MTERSLKAQVLVIGSGAGGASTALTLAELGWEVVVLEEGKIIPFTEYGARAVEAMPNLYRNGGMTPVLGRVPIGFVEGRCLGGSTEINSGFWQRISPEFADGWKKRYDLADATSLDLADHYQWAEQLLHVGNYKDEHWPRGTELMKIGAERMGWSVAEIPRAAPGCVNTNTCSTGCPTGAKQGMTRKLIPLAKSQGAKFISNCKVKRLVRNDKRVTGVITEIGVGDETRVLKIEAEHIIVCAGPSQTPRLLRASGISKLVGDTFRIHPMIKVVAMFPDNVDAEKSVLPFVQVKEFWPAITLGGSVSNAAHSAIILSENWSTNQTEMSKSQQMVNYYAAVKGTGKGSVRSARFNDRSVLRYDLSKSDLTNLSHGFARLCQLLFAAGAEKIFPSIQGMPYVKNSKEVDRWLDADLPADSLSLTTVHAFSSCPMGERRDLCVADSFGKVHELENLYINDASMLPDSPGTNPQGTIMALARRNALNFNSVQS